MKRNNVRKNVKLSMKMVSAPQWLVARCLFIRQGYERGTMCYVHQREKAGRVRCTTPSLTVTLCTYFMSRCSSVPHQISSNGRRFHAHRSAYRLRTVIVTPLQRHRANVYVLPVVSFMVYKERFYLQGWNSGKLLHFRHSTTKASAQPVEVTSSTTNEVG